MQRRIVWLVAATTSAVVLGFLIPLCWVVASLAEDRARTSATDQAQSIAGILASVPDSATVAKATSALSASGPVVHVVRANGDVFGASHTLPADLESEVERARRERAAFTIRADHGLDSIVPVVTSTGTDVVIATVPDDIVRAGVTRAWLILVAFGAVLIGGAVVLARGLGRRVSVPVMQVAVAAHRIREGDMSARAPVEGPPETVELGRALNQLAERIEELLVAERENVADLGHRLRTPVTALRLDSDLIQDPALAERFGDHIDHLQRSIDSVVRDARRTVRSSMPRSSDVCAVARDRVAFWMPLAEDQGRRLWTSLPEDQSPILLPLAPEDARELLDTLLDNVFAHTPEGADIHVAAARRRNSVRVMIEDGGPGLPAGYAGRGHSPSGSTGLGLSIVRRLVEASGGQMRLERSAMGGLAVLLDWPTDTELTH